MIVRNQGALKWSVQVNGWLMLSNQTTFGGHHRHAIFSSVCMGLCKWCGHEINHQIGENRGRCYPSSFVVKWMAWWIKLNLIKSKGDLWNPQTFHLTWHGWKHENLSRWEAALDVLQEEPVNAFIFSAAISSLAEKIGVKMFWWMCVFW